MSETSSPCDSSTGGSSPAKRPQMAPRTSTAGSIWREVEFDARDWAVRDMSELHKAGYWGYKCCEKYVEDKNEDAKLQEGDFEVEDLDEDDCLDEFGLMRQKTLEKRASVKAEVHGGKEDEKHGKGKVKGYLEGVRKRWSVA